MYAAYQAWQCWKAPDPVRLLDAVSHLPDGASDQSIYGMQTLYSTLSYPLKGSVKHQAHKSLLVVGVIQSSTCTLKCRRSTYATSLAKRGSVPIRDETGRFIGVRPKTAAERSQRQASGSGGIFKTAAVQVLRLERRLMATGESAVPLTQDPRNSQT